MIIHLFQVNFCKKCEDQGMFDKENMYPENCNKCIRPKYHKKHPNYCETRCNIILIDADEEKSETGDPAVTETALPDLGPLGNLFRAIVVAATS